MQALALEKAFTLIEPGPVVLITTNDGVKNNIMTITWTMVMGFSANFAITTGAWNHSYAALRSSRECVISIPTVDLIDTVIGIGTCSGDETDKFEKFGLTAAPGKHVNAPLIEDCLANIECRVTDFVDRHDIVVLEGMSRHIWTKPARNDARCTPLCDGTFIVDGNRLDRREMMRSQTPTRRVSPQPARCRAQVPVSRSLGNKDNGGPKPTKPGTTSTL